MKAQELADYRDLLGDIKARVRQAQHRAALSANAEMIRLYWDIGYLIAARQEREGWGAGVLPRLAIDLKNELPEEKGFSLRNLKLMVQFYRAYPERLAIGQRTVAQLMEMSSSTEIEQPAFAQTGAQSVPETEQLRVAAMLQRAAVQLSWLTTSSSSRRSSISPPASGMPGRHWNRAGAETRLPFRSRTAPTNARAPPYQTSPPRCPSPTPRLLKGC